MTEPNYITNKDANEQIKEIVMKEPITEYNATLIREIINILAKVVTT